MHSRKRDVTITVNGGTGQSGNVGSTLGTSLSVNVKNYLGANYSGVQVEWLVSDDSTCSPSASLTDASGIASTDLTLGSAAGTVTVTARCGRQTVTITATKTSTSAATITANSATDQSGTTSATVGAPPSVFVTDGNSNPVSGVSITWAVTAGGGSVNTTGATTTNASGVATLTSWTLGASAGLNTVTATSAGLSGSPVTFNANGVASAPTQIAVTSGGSQTGVTAGSAATATQFTVRDAGNNPVQGVTVSFSVTTGSGSLSVASAVTNASGQASVTYTTHTTVETATIAGSFTNAGGTVVTASTTIASAAGAKTKLAIQTQPASNGTSGVALTQQPIILIQDANSNTVLTATDTITAAVQSGNATIAGNTQAAVAGVATFTALTLTDADGGVNVLRFSTGALTTVDSSGTTLAPPIAAGLQFGVQPGTVTAGQATLTCNVYVVDSDGGQVPSATNAVTIAVTGGGASLTGTTTVNAVAGVATFSGIAVSTAGTFTLTATASGLTSATSASFTVNAASASDPNRPTDVSWTTAATLPLTSNAAMTTNGFTLTVGTLGTHLGTADGSTYSVNASGTTLTPGVGPVDSAGRIAWFKVRSQGNAQGRNSILEVLSMPQSSAKSLFFDFTVQMAANWDGHSSNQCKLFWYAVSSPNGGPYEGILAAWGANTTTPGFGPYFQGVQMDRSGIQSPRGSLTRGVWRRCQALFVAESSVGANDGIVKWWMDGTLIGSIANMDFGGITLRLPVLSIYWGGIGDSAANDLYVFMDYVKISYSTSRSAG